MSLVVRKLDLNLSKVNTQQALLENILEVDETALVQIEQLEETMNAIES